MTINALPAIFIVKLEKNKKILHSLSIKEFNYSDKNHYVNIYTTNDQDYQILNSLYGKGEFELGVYKLEKSDHIIYHRFFLTITNSVGTYGGRYTCNRIKDEIIYDFDELTELKLKTEILRNYDKINACE